LSVGSCALADAVTSEAIFSLLHESDRGAAILACTLVEGQLEGKLRSALRDSKLFETLFGVGRPLNFFGARNQLAYLMRIYGKPFYSELETICAIRNKFAHSFADKGRPIKTFKSPVIKDLCDKLRLIEPLLRAKEDRATSLRIGKLPSWMGDGPYLGPLNDPRTKYEHTCGLCSSALNGHLDQEIRNAIWGDTFP
jgi:hypothetical protein